MDKSLLVGSTLLAAGLTYCGASQVEAGYLWTAMVFMGGFMSAVVVGLILDSN